MFRKIRKRLLSYGSPSLKTSTQQKSSRSRQRREPSLLSESESSQERRNRRRVSESIRRTRSLSVKAAAASSRRDRKEEQRDRAEGKGNRPTTTPATKASSRRANSLPPKEKKKQCRLRTNGRNDAGSYQDMHSASKVESVKQLGTAKVTTWLQGNDANWSPLASRPQSHGTPRSEKKPGGHFQQTFWPRSPSHNAHYGSQGFARGQMIRSSQVPLPATLQEGAFPGGYGNYAHGQSSASKMPPPVAYISAASSTAVKSAWPVTESRAPGNWTAKAKWPQISEGEYISRRGTHYRDAPSKGPVHASESRNCGETTSTRKSKRHTETENIKQPNEKPKFKKDTSSRLLKRSLLPSLGVKSIGGKASSKMEPNRADSPHFPTIADVPRTQVRGVVPSGKPPQWRNIQVRAFTPCSGMVLFVMPLLERMALQGAANRPQSRLSRTLSHNAG